MTQTNHTVPPAESNNSGSEAHEDIGRRLREARQYLGLSQHAVASHLGVTDSTVSAMESGKRKVTGLEVQQLARLYRVPVNQLLEDPAETPSQVAAPSDATISALFRATKALEESDQQQVLRFARFLSEAGKAPGPTSDEG